MCKLNLSQPVFGTESVSHLIICPGWGTVSVLGSSARQNQPCVLDFRPSPSKTVTNQMLPVLTALDTCFKAT